MTRRNKPRRLRAAFLSAAEELRDRLVPEVPLDDPRAADLGRQWGRYKRRVNASSRFHTNPKAYRAWIRLTHDGGRFYGVCPYCGAHETPEEREELDALLAAYFAAAYPVITSPLS